MEVLIPPYWVGSHMIIGINIVYGGVLAAVSPFCGGVLDKVYETSGGKGKGVTFKCSSVKCSVGGCFFSRPLVYHEGLTAEISSEISLSVRVYRIKEFLCYWTNREMDEMELEVERHGSIDSA